MMVGPVSFRNESLAILEKIRIASEKQNRNCPFITVTTPEGNSFRGFVQVKGDHVVIHYSM